MTRIPVERRRGGFPWWGWLLIVLAVIALLIWLLFALLGGGEGEAGNAAVTTTAQEGEGGASAATTDQQTSAIEETTQGLAAEEPITDVLIIVEEPDRQSLVSRQVRLTGVEVQSVVGDQTFWVGPSNDQQLFVVLEEEQAPAGAEGKVDINAGQTLRITGVIKQLPSMERARDLWDLSAANSAQLENQEIYLLAERVQVTER